MEVNKKLLGYLVRFLGLFCLLFYGTEAVIGLSAPGSHYSSFVAQHLNFIPPFRLALLEATKALLSPFGVHTAIEDAYSLTLVGGRGVRMVYSCLGYGVLSFWIAFIFANRGSWKKKAGWMLAGCLALCAINVIRIALLLVAINRGWAIPLGWDHHTWFTLVAYLLIFALILGYDRTERPGRTAAIGGGKRVRRTIPAEAAHATDHRLDSSPVK